MRVWPAQCVKPIFSSVRSELIKEDVGMIREGELTTFFELVRKISVCTSAQNDDS